MTNNLEQIEPKIFAYILENPSYFHRVEPDSFKTPNLSKIYRIVRDYYINHSGKSPIVPNNKKISEMVRFEDPTNMISNEYINTLLEIDISEYQQGTEDNWLRNIAQAWCVHSDLMRGIFKAADMVRNISPIDYEKVESTSNSIRDIMAKSTHINFDDDNMGLDFFNAQHHLQEVSKNKIPTGWGTLDTLTNGGWDLKTLNVIIGPSNSGKSLWLSNIAANTMLHGKNVIYFTLEMSEAKILKRIGSITLRIPINEYDDMSKNTKFMQDKLKDLKSRSAKFTNDSDLFSNNIGNLNVKEYPAGSATVADLDQYIKKYQEEKGYKIDLVIVDYLTIMKPDNNTGNLFINGKQLSEGLRAIGQKHNIAMVTAMQVAKDNFGANDINLSDISESKAIVEGADTLFGIIRTDEMRKNNKYILKLLKMRDGGFGWLRTHFNFNDKYLLLEGDTKIPD